MPHLTDDRLSAAVALAVRAPSLHNSQPWRFQRVGDTVEVFADLKRQLPVADPTGRGVRLACGAAIMNLRLAFSVQGWQSSVAILPDRARPNVLARVTPGIARPASPEETALAAAIPRRHSQRAPFLDSAVPTAYQAQLVEAAQREGASLTVVASRAGLADVAELIRSA